MLPSRGLLTESWRVDEESLLLVPSEMVDRKLSSRLPLRSCVLGCPLARASLTLARDFPDSRDELKTALRSLDLVLSGSLVASSAPALLAGVAGVCGSESTDVRKIRTAWSLD